MALQNITWNALNYGDFLKVKDKRYFEKKLRQNIPNLTLLSVPFHISITYPFEKVTYGKHAFNIYLQVHSHFMENLQGLCGFAHNKFKAFQEDLGIFFKAANDKTGDSFYTMLQICVRQTRLGAIAISYSSHCYVTIFVHY